jgi:hypothetical protein
LFINKTNAIIQKANTPNIEDGVLINAAPLWELLPFWPDTKKAWQELEQEKYDWAHQAMDHWPDRVQEKCKTSKSFAIAHGLEDLCEVGDMQKAESGKGRRKRTTSTTED